LRADDRRQRSRHVGDDVVPLTGNLVFAEEDFRVHRLLP
jgi:hypothetical protein